MILINFSQINDYIVSHIYILLSQAQTIMEKDRIFDFKFFFFSTNKKFFFLIFSESDCTITLNQQRIKNIMERLL